MMLVELTSSAESDIGDAAVAYELERADLGFRRVLLSSEFAKARVRRPSQ